MKTILLLSLLSLFSCAAALVPASNDPQTKLNQAASLFQNGRAVGALSLIKQAIPMFEEKGDKEGLARAYLAYGDVYKSGVSEGAVKLPDLNKAAESYKKAAEVYHTLNFSLSESMYLWFAGSLYGSAGDLKSACSNLNQAEKAFKLDSPDKSRYASADALPGRIKEEKKKWKCLNS